MAGCAKLQTGIPPMSPNKHRVSLPTHVYVAARRRFPQLRMVVSRCVTPICESGVLMTPWSLDRNDGATANMHV